MKKSFINSRRLLMIGLLLFITIGFAYLSSNLNIRGLIGYSASSWDVHFENVQVTGNLIGADDPVIDNNKTIINFSGTFKEPSEYYEFCVDVVNAGTIDAMIDEIIKTGITNDNENYFNFIVKYYNDTDINQYDLLAKGLKSRIKVRVEYKYNVNAIPDLNSEMNFSLALTYVKANSQARSVNSGNFINSSKSNVFKLNNAKVNPLFDFKIYGNTEQTNYTGQNLYNYKDVSSNSQAVSRESTVDNDGWITMTYDNTSGSVDQNIHYWTNSLNVDNNKTYTVVMEVKNVSGQDSIAIRPTTIYYDEGQFLTHRYYFNEITNNSIYIYTTTPRDNYNGLNGLRTYATFPVGTSGSITFRLSVIEGTDVTAENFVYEPYVGGIPSPNPDYPQEVNKVTGNSQLKITGKNLLNYTNIGSEAHQHGIIVDENGYISDSSPLLDQRIWKYENSNFFASLEAGTYTLSFRFSKQTNQPDGYDSLNVYTESNQILFQRVLHGKNEVIIPFTLTEPTNIGVLAKTYEGIYRIQLEEGNTATEWEPYKEKTYPISLGNIELNQIEDYRDYIYNKNGKWYVYKIIDKLIFDGSENWSTIDANQRFLLSENIFNKLKNISINLLDSGRNITPIYSNYYVSGFQHESVYNSNVLSFSQWEGIKYMYLGKKYDSVDELKLWLSTNNLIVYYYLPSPIDEEIKDTNLINQLNAIYADSLFDGYNYITYTSNIDTDIEFNYLAK